jgi:hypothetical protein
MKTALQELIEDVNRMEQGLDVEELSAYVYKRATELLEKEREVEERCREVFELGASAFQDCLNPHTLEFDHETFKRLKEEAVNQNK